MTIGTTVLGPITTFAAFSYRTSLIPRLALHWTEKKGGRTKLAAPSGEVTALLRAWGAGDRSVESCLFEAVLPDLRRIARSLIGREPPGHSLQPSALLNEAYLRLVSARERGWENRRHFFAIAARIMRRFLVDHARGRPNARFVGLDDIAELMRDRSAQIEEAIAIDSLLDELEALHPELCQIVEMRFFLGLTEEESAEAIGVPLRTAQRRFADARRWLFEKLESNRA